MIPSSRVVVFPPCRMDRRAACNFLAPLARTLLWGCMVCARRYRLLIPRHPALRSALLDPGLGWWGGARQSATGSELSDSSVHPRSDGAIE
jgi:hypothetical protein